MKTNKIKYQQNTNGNFSMGHAATVSCHLKLFPCSVSIGKLIHMIRFYFLFHSFPLQSSLLSGWVQGQGDNLEPVRVNCPWYASVAIAVWMIEAEPLLQGRFNNQERPSCWGGSRVTLQLDFWVETSSNCKTHLWVKVLKLGTKF